MIYAGNTFVPCTNSDNSTTCDSCAKWGAFPIQGAYTAIGGGTDWSVGNYGLACNSQQIYPGLGFSVTMSSTDASMYAAGTTCATTPVIATGGTSAGAILPDITTTETNPGTAGSSITATWSWGLLCNRLNNGDSTCTKSFSNTFTVGFSKDCSTIAETGVRVQVNFRYVGFSPPQTFGDFSGCSGAAAYEGFCHFAVYPGDEKVYVDSGAQTGVNFAAGDLSDNGNATSPAYQNYPTSADSSNMKYGYLRMYYEQADSSFATITMASAHTDLAVTGTSLAESRVMNLTNSKPYAFLSANVDQAGNVTLFSDPSYTKNTGTMSAVPGQGADIGKTQAAIPEKVYGLLDDKHCFIATAAYGSIDAGVVESLRKFRNQYLLNWNGGRQFVKFYYKISPPIAQFISEREWLKTLVREGLEPIVMLTALIFEYGLIALLIIVLIAGIIFSGSVGFLKRGTAK